MKIAQVGVGDGQILSYILVVIEAPTFPSSLTVDSILIVERHLRGASGMANGTMDVVR